MLRKCERQGGKQGGVSRIQLAKQVNTEVASTWYFILRNGKRPQDGSLGVSG